VLFWYETDRPTDREPILADPAIVQIGVDAAGLSPALNALRDWKPDLLYAHGLVDHTTERQVLDIAPPFSLRTATMARASAAGKRGKRRSPGPASGDSGGPAAAFLPAPLRRPESVRHGTRYRDQGARLETLSRTLPS